MNKNNIISHMYIGEHLQTIGIHMCYWLNSILLSNIPSKRFSLWWYIWERDSKCKYIPEVTIVHNEEEFWCDHLSYDHINPQEFYKKSLDNGVTEFIPIDNNGYIDIISIKGKPSKREIIEWFFKEVEDPVEIEDGDLEMLYNYIEKDVGY